MSVPVRLAKARTTCDSKTGQVEIIWLENATSVDGFLGKDVLASGSTKNVYQVWTMVLALIRLVLIESSSFPLARIFLLQRGSLRLVRIMILLPLRMRNI